MKHRQLIRSHSFMETVSPRHLPSQFNRFLYTDISLIMVQQSSAGIICPFPYHRIRRKPCSKRQIHQIIFPIIILGRKHRDKVKGQLRKLCRGIRNKQPFPLIRLFLKHFPYPLSILKAHNKDFRQRLLYAPAKHLVRNPLQPVFIQMAAQHMPEPCKTVSAVIRLRFAKSFNPFFHAFFIICRNHKISEKHLKPPAVIAHSNRIAGKQLKNTPRKHKPRLHHRGQVYPVSVAFICPCDLAVMKASKNTFLQFFRKIIILDNRTCDRGRLSVRIRLPLFIIPVINIQAILLKKRRKLHKHPGTLLILHIKRTRKAKLILPLILLNRVMLQRLRRKRQIIHIAMA